MSAPARQAPMMVHAMAKGLLCEKAVCLHVPGPSTLEEYWPLPRGGGRGSRTTE